MVDTDAWDEHDVMDIDCCFVSGRIWKYCILVTYSIIRSGVIGGHSGGRHKTTGKLHVQWERVVYDIGKRFSYHALLSNPLIALRSRSLHLQMIRTRAFPQTYYARTVFPAPIQESVGLHHVFI